MPNEIRLRYGGQDIDLTQSARLIGIRPERNQDANARAAVSLTLDGADWADEGLLGGFRIVGIEDARVDADKALDRIRSHASVMTGTHVFELPNQSGILVPTGDIYVEFTEKASDAERHALLDEYHLAIKDARPEGMILSVTPSSPNPVKVAYALQQSPAVTIAEPDFATQAAQKELHLPVDGLLGEQWHLRNTGFHRGTSVGFLAGADARVIDAWRLAGTTGLANVVVAVIDDGFDLRHPDFTMPGKYVHPWDFTRRTSDPRPMPGNWHGTACAGVAVAGAGGGGVVGAAPGCTLMPVRWGADLSDAQIEAWFDYVTLKGAWVVSCSWGARNRYFPLSTRAGRAIEKCARQGRGGKGCVIVFAAGNEFSNTNDPAAGTVSGFANHPDVIAVAASTSRDEHSDYSNYGKEISVCAPSSGAGGWGILTSDVTGRTSGGFQGYADGDYTYTFGGTSSACPLVAGVAALVLSVKPDLTSADVKRLLQQTARKIGPASAYVKGHAPQFGYGCVDAAAAVRKILPGAQPLVATMATAARLSEGEA